MISKINMEEEDIIDIFSDSEEDDDLNEKGNQTMIALPKNLHKIYLEEEELLNKVAVNRILLEKLKKELDDHKIKHATNKMIIQNVKEKINFLNRSI